jgi:NADP-dependent 3-hydroxy acid dehydrogenase YdfG
LPTLASGCSRPLGWLASRLALPCRSVDGVDNGYSGTKFAVHAISEGLRQEVGSKVRVTSIEPGAVDSDLKFTTTGTAQANVMEFYKAAIPASSIARAMAVAIEQPADVDVNEIVVRPTAQEF